MDPHVFLRIVYSLSTNFDNNKIIPLSPRMTGATTITRLYREMERGPFIFIL